MLDPLPKQPTIKEQYIDLIDKVFWHGFNHKAAPGSTQPYMPGEYADQLLALFDSYALDLIGEDEPTKIPEPNNSNGKTNGIAFARNKLRDELRAKHTKNMKG